MTTATVAANILQQLGGSRFLAMTGAKNLLSSENALQFRLPANVSRRVRFVRVVLTPADLYEVTAFDAKAQPVESLDSVYADRLRNVFTRLTGLETSL